MQMSASHIRHWFLGTFVLALVAVAGNFLSIPLFFGIVFIFGSIAMIIAIVLYGTVAGIIVAVVGSLYTVVLFGHPYAVIIFTFEAVVVGMFYRRGFRNLVLADLIYWSALGIFLVLLFYRNQMGMPWEPTILIALKQSLNGIFNALIASITLLLFRTFSRKRQKSHLQKPDIQSIFFISILTLILIASIGPIIQQSRQLQQEREQALLSRLLHKAVDVAQEVSNADIKDLQSILNGEFLSDEIKVAILAEDNTVLASRGQILSIEPGGQSKRLTENASIWSPAEKMPTMTRWKKSYYVITFAAKLKDNVSQVVVEYTALPLVLSLEKSFINQFILIAVMMIIGILFAQLFSYWFARPIKQLELAGRNMASAIYAGKPSLFPSSFIQEFESLSNTFSLMSSQLANNFQELHQVKDSLEQQVEERTEDLERANLELKDRQYALDQHAIVSISDTRGDIVYANDRFCEISEYSRDELLGENHRILKSGIEPDSVYDDMWQTISSGSTWQGTICNRSKTGRLYWVKTTITPFLDSRGKPYQYIAIRTDITRAKAAELALRQSEERLGFAIEGAGDGIWDWNLSDKSMSFSKLYETMLGYDEHELVQHESTWLNSVHPDDIPYVEKKLQAYLTGEKSTYQVELRIQCKDGHYKWILCRGMAFERDESGASVRMIGIHTDIDEHKKVEHDLIKAREEADKANKAKSEFLSRVSHELRTPMNAILGFGQLLEMDKTLKEKQVSHVRDILSGGNHLLQLINEILDLSRIESGSIELKPEPVILEELFAECIRLTESLAEQQKVDVKLMSDKQVVVNVDRIRLKQVILNLLSNAIKYNRKNGTVIIRVEKTEDKRVLLQIEDTGYGISAEELKDVFQPFKRLEAAHGEIEGTGIGLTITRSIVEIMGSKLELVSEKDKGSRFWFELPLA